MTRAEMLGRMSSAELSEWVAYDRVEPLPDPHWSAALIASTVYNANAARGRGAKLRDFLPRASRRPAGRSVAETAAAFRAWAARAGG